jgi:hypothetical protein
MSFLDFFTKQANDVIYKVKNTTDEVKNTAAIAVMDACSKIPSSLVHNFWWSSTQCRPEKAESGVGGTWPGLVHYNHSHDHATYFTNS